MRTAFKKIAIMARGKNSGITETLQALTRYLQDQKYEICIEADTVDLIEDTGLPTVDGTRLSETCELLIVVGGDGSMIKGAHLAAPQDIPVLGINRGRVGFLTDIHPYEFEELERVLAGEYTEEHRFMLANEFHDDRNHKHSDLVLNEVALYRGMIPRMIEFQIFIDHQFVCHYRSDGLITATPTGSTAYALSGGGPILHPKLNSVVLVPMFSHTLTSRPVVIPGDSEIEILIDEKAENTPCISCDGQDRVCIGPGSSVFIRKADTVLRLIHPEDYNYFETLRTKLHWESIKGYSS